MSEQSPEEIIFGSRVDILKSMLESLGLFVSIDTILGGRKHLVIQSDDGDEITFAFEIDGQLDYVSVWKP